MATITVDGRKIEAKNGALLIDELFKNDINIPHFCYHPALGKDGNCRMCMVEIEGKKRPQIACDTPVSDDMVIRTKGENIERVKRSILELELINHPIDCPICDQAGECDLQNYYMEVGLYDSRLGTPKVRGKKHVDLGSNVMLDQERCVLCTRCVRFTKNITKTNELGVLNRTDHSVITTFPGRPLDNAYAMNVVDLCPVGALTSKDFRFHKRVWFLKPDEAICNGCSRGCSIYVDHHKAKYEPDSIFRYRPRVNEKVNGYFICDFGRLSYKEENKNRTSKPMIRGAQSEYEYAKGKLQRVLKRHHGKILFLLSPSLSLEEMSRVKKLSEKFDTKISGYDTNEYDESFGDEFLRCSDLSSNRRGLKLLSIDESKEYLESAIKESELVIFIGRDDVDILSKENVVKVVLNAKEPANTEGLDLYLPILTHTCKEGSYINIDGYVQFSKAHVDSGCETESLLRILSVLQEDGVFTCKDIWDEELSSVITQFGFEDIQNEAMKLDRL